MTKNKKLPELLAPAGTREALDAAIRAGADAVYFGGSRFNARMAADNFAGDAMGEAIRACAFYGVRSNITLNTLPREREQADVLRYGEQLCLWGADAVICADLGTAALLHKYFPEMPLHASTQCSGHNVDAARFFADLGFSRMVAARELSFADLKTICDESPIETELFIHGAICVSQSGGCLFSSLVGGRSGNRGACAQPCRLPYRCTVKEPGGGYSGEDYPLSIKDMCLASHIPELLSLGAASFKIEGRMKSPAYVDGVISIYRRLLDEGRNADEKELAKLAALFSRNGFTDGYFRGKTGSFMQGVRSERDKALTLQAEKEVLSGKKEPRRIPVSLTFSAKDGEAMTLTMTSDRASVTVTGEEPLPTAETAPAEDAVRSNLTRLGQTVFAAEHVDIRLSGSPLCAPSSLNKLRRAAAEKLDEVLRALPPCEGRPTKKKFDGTDLLPDELTKKRRPYSGEVFWPRQASFLFTDRIPASARDFYDILYLPAEVFVRDADKALALGVNGIVLPPVIFPGEYAAMRGILAKAKTAGIVHAMVSNVGHIALALEYGFTLHGGLRCNLYTGLSGDVWAEAGCSDLLLSPELTMPQIRDVTTSVPKGAVTYGRIPLMTMQRCIIREAAHIPDGKPCSRCDGQPFAYLSDRRHTVFPVVRCFPHRNVIYNSAPFYMADKPGHETAMRLDFVHHLFTTENAKEAERVMRAYFTEGTYPPPAAFRRIQS